MNIAIGQAGVVLGLAASVFGIIALAVGLYDDRPVVRRTAAWYAVMAFVGAALAVLAMERALITRDFTVGFVHDHGSSQTPRLYNVATLWSALEGSILLWVLILTGYVVATVIKFRNRLDDKLVAWALLTMFVVTAFFFVLLVSPSLASPFRHVSNVPLGYDGPGPNPLLQNHPLMAIHPPMLYLGYVGFTVPFSFAVAALVTGRLGEGWLVATRRWTLIAWGFLTFGIVLGAWWSYEVLGWGGYWAWDPVENASFLPWLTGTAYLHSVMVQERRGMLRVWNLSLVCATFALTILGTFLTRSGVLDSVHAFSDSNIGLFLLSFFGLIVVVTCGLVAWRGPQLRSPGRIDAVRSREAAFLVNNLLFAAFAFVVLLGTVFPLIIEAVRGDRITVGRPFFDTMAMPLGLALLFLMAVAPVLPWRKASTETLAQRLHWPLWVGTATLVASVVIGARGLAPLLAFALGGFAGGAALRQVVLATRRQGWRGLVGRTNGGMIVHLGVILIGIALTASQSYDHERRLTLNVGESAVVAGHTVTYLGSHDVELANRTETVARVQLDGGQVYEPALQRFAQGSNVVGTPSVRTGPTEDVYFALLADPGDGPAQLRVIVQPLILWLWVGGGMMFAGSFLAAFPGRRRDPLSPTSAPIDARADDIALDDDDELVGGGRVTDVVDRVDDDTSGDDDGDDDEVEVVARSRRLGPVVASVGVLVFVLALLVVLATREPAENRLAESPLIGRPAPGVSGTTLDGDTFTLDGAPGRYMLVNFFASWCQPCQAEHDDLIAFSRRHEAAGDAGIVSVVFDDSTDDARAFFDERGGDWPVIVGDEGDIALDYGVIKLPETFVVGPDGTVLYRIAGAATVEGLDALIADLEGLTP